MPNAYVHVNAYLSLNIQSTSAYVLSCGRVCAVLMPYGASSQRERTAGKQKGEERLLVAVLSV